MADKRSGVYVSTVLDTITHGEMLVKHSKNGLKFPISSHQDIGQQSHRRKWDKDEYERRARDREDEERGEAKKKRDDKAKKGA